MPHLSSAGQAAATRQADSLRGVAKAEVAEPLLIDEQKHERLAQSTFRTGTRVRVERVRDLGLVDPQFERAHVTPGGAIVEIADRPVVRRDVLADDTRELDIADWNHRAVDLCR